jgi:hypothetical protein
LSEWQTKKGYMPCITEYPDEERVRESNERAFYRASLCAILTAVENAGFDPFMSTLDEGDVYVGKLLHRLNSVKEALEEAHALNQNFVSVVEPDVLEHLSEYRIVLDQAERALERGKDDKQV